MRAFKYKLRLKPEQARMASSYAGATRWLYNKGLETRQAHYSETGKTLSYPEICKLLTGWRAETPWLREVPVHACQQALKDLDTAYKNFFSGTGSFPVFKKKGKCQDSFRYPDSKQIRLDQGNSRICVPKLGWIRYRNSRPVQGAVRNATFSRNAGHWYISVQTKHEVPDPVHQSTSAIGIDLGVAVFAACSDGTNIDALHAGKRSAANLKWVQKRLAKRVKFSANWIRQKGKLTKIQAAVARQRQDFLHKASKEISKNHAMIAMEALKVKNMSASAAGTKEEPGTNVKAKSGLNKSILDQGWFEFRRQLDYKSKWLGGQLVLVNPAYTSQTCSDCGCVDAGSRVSQSEFHCRHCGHQENADTNAAKNILRGALESMAAGQAVTACGGTRVAGPVKHEPTEAPCVR